MLARGRIGDWDWQLRKQLLEVSRGELGEPGYEWQAHVRGAITGLEIQQGDGAEVVRVMMRTAGGWYGMFSAECALEEAKEFCRAVGGWLEQRG